MKDVMFDNLLYAETAIRSYREFSELKQRGIIPAHCRFQVDLVPAHSVIWLFVQENLHRALDPIYNHAVQREIDRLAAVIPHNQLAIQFDVASAVFARLQLNEPNAYGQNKEEMLKTFGTIFGRARRLRAGRHRALVSLLLRRFQSSSRRRAYRHGGHGCARQLSFARDQPSHPVDPYAGSAQSRG